MGGVCLRVDRVLKLDDGIRIPPNTALFERGNSFPRIRIQDLPRLPLLEVSGRVVHASERGSEILLGLNFEEPTEEQARSLGDSLALREKMFQGKTGAAVPDSATGPHAAALKAASEAEAPGERPELPQHQTSARDPLSLLERKTARLLLVGTGGPLMEACQRGLWQNGYHRLEIVQDCETALSIWQDESRAKPRLLMVDLSLAQLGDQEPLAAVRFIEHQLAAFGGVPAVILCENLDPTMLLGQMAGTHFLACGSDERDWVESLDDLLGIGFEQP